MARGFLSGTAEEVAVSAAATPADSPAPGDSSSACPASKRCRPQPTTLLLHNLPLDGPEESMVAIQSMRQRARDARGRPEVWGDVTLTRSRERTTVQFGSRSAAALAPRTLRANGILSTML